MLPEPTTKNAPRNSNKKSKKAVTAKTGFDTQSPGKGGPVTCSNKTKSR